jgi:menaquinone-specific isochorismate synthase
MKYRIVAVQQPFDLNDVCRGDGFLFVRNNAGHAARGIAAQCSGDNVSDLLSSLQQAPESLPGSPLAFGLVPFLPTSQATFFVPHATFSIHEDGSRTLTLIGETDNDLDDNAVSRAISEALAPVAMPAVAGSYSVSPATPINTYLTAVTAARDAVRRGDIQKAVIARDIDVTSETPFNIHGVLLRLRSSFGSSYRFCVDNMIGASPELLVQVDGRTVRSHPLAGTAPRTGDPDTDARLAAELIASTKNQIEHRVVIDMVHDTLLPHCSYLDWEAEPSIVTVANVQHLGTAIEGALAEPVPNVLQLVRALCPTPALGGSPSRDAIDLIVQHEGFERGNYGGAVGWVDASGNGTFAVTIRCAELNANRTRARLFAGGGIVAESEPLAELAETQAKFQAMLSALIRP